jgi:ubiquinone/menaquinone biosynthesis C-methylase UbiE
MLSATAPITNEAVRAQWDAAAEGWDSQAPALRAWLEAPTRATLSMAEIGPGGHVLDVAAGAGEQTVTLAEQVGPAGRVVAIDISPGLVQRLRRNLGEAGLAGVEARVADAQERLPEVGGFDAAICRLGLMLMPEPRRCLEAIRFALKPGGRFAAMVFAEPEANPCLGIVVATAMRHAGLPPRDPFAPGGLFSLGRPGDLGRLFETAGFGAVATVRIEAPFRLPTVDDYVAFLQAAAAPVRAMLARLAPVERQSAWREIRDQLAVFEGAGGWVGPNTLLLTAGRA